MVKHLTKTDFTFIDLFAGIGGTRIAFQRAGGRCVFSSEKDKGARQTYSSHFNDHFLHGDITQVDKNTEIPDHDVLIAGFEYDAEARRQKWLKDIADILTPLRSHRGFNYSVLDFTMNICAKKPLCSRCPVSRHCFYKANLD